MRVFTYKTINVILIAVILLVYQEIAEKRSKEVMAFNEKVQTMKREWEAESKKLSGDDDTSNYQDGQYEGVGKGFGGEIKVSVSIEKGEISSVKIISAKDETPEYIDKASSITDAIIMEQRTDVDVISGATLSSNGILDAVEEALAKAGGTN